MAAERELGLDQLFQCRDSQLGEPRDVALRERLVGEIRERRAAPQRQRVLEQRERALGPTGPQRRPALADEPLEPVRIQAARLELELVAMRPRDDRPVGGAERLPQPRDMGLQGLGAPSREDALPTARRSAAPRSASRWHAAAAARAERAACSRPAAPRNRGRGPRAARGCGNPFQSETRGTVAPNLQQPGGPGQTLARCHRRVTGPQPTRETIAADVGPHHHNQTSRPGGRHQQGASHGPGNPHPAPRRRAQVPLHAPAHPARDRDDRRRRPHRRSRDPCRQRQRPPQRDPRRRTSRTDAAASASPAPGAAPAGPALRRRTERRHPRHHRRPAPRTAGASTADRTRAPAASSPPRRRTPATTADPKRDRAAPAVATPDPLPMRAGRKDLS